MEIRIATTLEEKQKIYSLRYECYVAELGWKYDEVGVEKRELCDPEDETGVLWRKRWQASDHWAAVEVINGTPEPDGTHKHYFLQVPAHLGSRCSAPRLE